MQLIGFTARKLFSCSTHVFVCVSWRRIIRKSITHSFDKAWIYVRHFVVVASYEVFATDRITFIFVACNSMTGYDSFYINPTTTRITNSDIRPLVLIDLYGINRTSIKASVIWRRAFYRWANIQLHIEMINHSRTRFPAENNHILFQLID